MNVIPKEVYDQLKPLIDQNKVCKQCWRSFKKPIKTRWIKDNSIMCQKCINAINNCRWC
jgi:hypothetical protein